MASLPENKRNNNGLPALPEALPESGKTAGQRPRALQGVTLPMAVMLVQPGGNRVAHSGKGCKPAGQRLTEWGKVVESVAVSCRGGLVIYLRCKHR
jgi:hypothetical protein